MTPLPEELRRRIRDDGGRGVSILVLRTGAYGDILRTLPPVRLIRAALPRSRIHWLVDDRWAEVLEGHPDLDGIFAVPRREWKRMARSPRAWTALAASLAQTRASLRAIGAGLVLDFNGNLRSGVLGRLSGAPVRIGYSGHDQREGNLLFTTHRVPPGPRRRSRMERNLELVRALGIPDAPLPGGGLPIAAADAASALRLVADALGAETAYGVIAPGASARQAYKKPPPALLAAAARAAASRGVRSVVVHGPGERLDAERVVAEAGDSARVAAPVSLRTLAALVSRARLLVAGDTGPLHLACALGRPAVGLFGPTDPVVGGPWGVPHAVVSPPRRTYTGIKKADRDAGGFEGIEPKAVEAAVLDLLARLPEEAGS